MSREVQFATVSLQVALPLDADLPNNHRIQAVENTVQHLLEQGDSMEFRHFSTATSLGRTETMQEAVERRGGEAESRAEAKLDERRERYFDNHGHY